MLLQFIIEALSPHHDRRSFDCGIQDLNEYLQRYAGQHQRKGIGRTYVAIEEGSSAVVGYYAISAGALAFETVPESLPCHPVPVALIGRLAVASNQRGLGLGEMLLIHALRSAQSAADVLGIYAVVVDAFDQQAKTFYLKYGVKGLLDDQLHLYLPMKVIKQLKL